MTRGDHLKASRPLYSHHGIDLGDGHVVHFAADRGGSKPSACIRISTLNEFAGDGEISIVQYANMPDREVIVQRALSKVGEARYDLLSNNCEHFARWCVTGSHRSEQVVAVTSMAAASGLPYLSAAMGLNLVSWLGPMGLSGPGIMSGLATVGGFIGGGAVAGISVLGAAPAIITFGALCTYTFPNENMLPEAERNARLAGRIGAGAGGVVGVVATTLVVGSLGVSGLSAVGISTGLASLGAILGSGMAAGVGLAIAIPTLAVILGAYLARSLCSFVQRTYSLPAN